MPTSDFWAIVVGVEQHKDSIDRRRWHQRRWDFESEGVLRSLTALSAIVKEA